MRRAGFTLIELIIVVAVIGVMIAGALVSLAAGRDAAHVREGTRAVAQLSSYATALALLRQRPVVVTYRHNRIDVQISGEVVEKDDIGSPAEPIYREVGGEETPGVNANGDDGESEDRDMRDAGERDGRDGKTGFFFTRQILDPEELAKEDTFREFADVELKVEVLDDNGNVLGAEDAARLSLAQPREGKSAHGGEEGDEEDSSRNEDGEIPVCITYETNGRCQPYRVFVMPSGVEDSDDAAMVSVSRSGKATIGDEEDVRTAQRRRRR